MIGTPVKYKSTFKVKELEKGKLQQSLEDGSKIEVEVSLYTGQQGLEGLIYIVREFESACKVLDWTKGSEMFEGFTRVLRGQAYIYWIEEVLKAFPTEDNRTSGTFQEAINMLKVFFGGGRFARNRILQYILTDECSKTRESTVKEHVRRIATLVSLANWSAGTDTEVTEARFNELLFSTMPDQWKREFELSYCVLSDMTTREVVDFFKRIEDVYNEIVYNDMDTIRVEDGIVHITL